MSLTLSLATRSRPALLIETVRRTLPNMSRADTFMVISMDQDDSASLAARDELYREINGDPRVIVSVREREDSLGAKWNRAVEIHPADVYVPMVDYAPHITPEFDQRIIDAAAVFPDNIGVVYNRYCCKCELPAINGVTAGLVDKMGYIYAPFFPFSLIDLWLDDIARLIDRISFADVETDVSKRQRTIGRRDTKFWGVLLDMLYPHRIACAKRIINSPEFLEAPWRKQLLLRNITLSAQRAGFVSQACRKDAAWIDRGVPFESPEDEARYMRIKANGRSLLQSLVNETERVIRSAAE